MISIDVVSENDLWNKKIKKTDIFFNSLAKVFPKKYRFNKKKVSLTILLTNNKIIKKLNKKFRNKNKATDILSFPSQKKINIKKSPYIGDIAISYEFMNKVTKIFIHGFLHLLGYDHIKLKDFKVMLIEEEKIYQTIKKKITQIV